MRRGGTRRWIPWVLGLVVVVGVVAGVAYYLLAGGGKTYAVPLVNGEPVAQAQQQIQAQHLRSTVVDQASSSVKQGLVINSNPQQGNNVPANTVVTLFVSKGAAPVAVPNVVGQQETAAESALQNAGFKAAAKNDPTSSAPLGQVTAQSPSQGTAAPGSTVTITVSGGAVTVPSVVGDSQATANQILTHGWLPGQRSAGVGTGSVHQRNGLQPGARQRQRGEGLHGHDLRTERRSLRPALRPPRPHRAPRPPAAAAVTGSEVLTVQASAVRETRIARLRRRADYA